LGELVARVGADRVEAIDPSASFVDAARQRHPGVTVQVGVAERMPYPDGTFDTALAQLVVHFMNDPIAGLTEMARVTRRGGTVAGCVWDHASGAGPLGVFWRVARDLDPAVHDESDLAGVREGHLAELMTATGAFESVNQATLEVTVEHPTFDEWWEPFTRGVGPAGAYVGGLDNERRVALRARCRRALPSGPFHITARAWAVCGVRGEGTPGARPAGLQSA
jgi:SAM-dependent methyltransferase